MKKQEGIGQNWAPISLAIDAGQVSEKNKTSCDCMLYSNRVGFGGSA